MRLSKFTDYALRTLLLAASRPGSLVTIRETAEIYDISQAHLKKVVRLLADKGYLAATRGHGGGFGLGRPPQEINLGHVIRDTEPDFALVGCYHPDFKCLISRSCRLPGVLDRALLAYFEVLDQHSLQDLMLSPRAFGLPDPDPGRARRDGAPPTPGA